MIKIKYNYMEYKDCPEATAYSHSRNYPGPVMSILTWASIIAPILFFAFMYLAIYSVVKGIILGQEINTFYLEKHLGESLLAGVISLCANLYFYVIRTNITEYGIQKIFIKKRFQDVLTDVQDEESKMEVENNYKELVKAEKEKCINNCKQGVLKGLKFILKVFLFGMAAVIIAAIIVVLVNR